MFNRIRAGQKPGPGLFCLFSVRCRIVWPGNREFSKKWAVSTTLVRGRPAMDTPNPPMVRGGQQVIRGGLITGSRMSGGDLRKSADGPRRAAGDPQRFDHWLADVRG